MPAESPPNCASYSAKLPTVRSPSTGPAAVAPTNAVVEVGTPAMAHIPDAASSTKTPGKRCSGMHLAPAALLRRDGGARVEVGEPPVHCVRAARDRERLDCRPQAAAAGQPVVNRPEGLRSD